MDFSSLFREILEKYGSRLCASVKPGTAGKVRSTVCKECETFKCCREQCSREIRSCDLTEEDSHNYLHHGTGLLCNDCISIGCTKINQAVFKCGCCGQSKGSMGFGEQEVHKAKRRRKAAQTDALICLECTRTHERSCNCILTLIAAYTRAII